MTMRRGGWVLAGLALVALLAWMMRGLADSATPSDERDERAGADALGLPAASAPALSLAAPRPPERPPSPARELASDETALNASGPVGFIGHSSESLTLEVVFASGVPASRTWCLLDLGAMGRTFGATDASGRWAVIPRNEPATLQVNAPPVYTFALEPGGGHRRIVLPDNAAISGSVTIRGEPPGARVVPLAVRRPPPPETGDFALAGKLRALDGGLRNDPYSPSFHDARDVTGDGAFAVAGFVPDGVGTLTVGGDYRLRGGAAELEVRAPRAGLIVDVEPLPTVRGRAVRFDTRQPVPYCFVRFTADPELSETRANDDLPVVTTDADGRFAITFREGPGLVALWISDEGGTGLVSALLHAEDLGPAGEDRDLGDIPLRRPRTVAFRVRDASGAPIRYAVATARLVGNEMSLLTDTEGRGRLRSLPPEPVELTVLAARYEASTVRASGPGDEELDVVLDRCASLEVTVRPSNGELPKPLSLSLAVSEQVFTGRAPIGPELARRRLDRYATIGFQGELDAAASPPLISGTITYRLTPDGTASVSCLEPGVPLHLSITDAQGATLWGPETITLARGEAHALEAYVPGVPGK